MDRLGFNYVNLFIKQFCKTIVLNAVTIKHSFMAEYDYIHFTILIPNIDAAEGHLIATSDQLT